ncbi:TspO/MBR family protein [Croceicoccus marinus]|jgi:tryptophan-rich sensory protein|uniref:Tryptophan-rich sensory protein n=1 Tax=Croceicoccus marinus TaxID=450378 RepID=A0A7G6VQJ0_9SPHN|nr:TspO/MBR family protein [Croceicoccus marinus]QNE04005.1 tryptophan-rich sensory protein [Croceicoccus marinus]
MEPPVRNEPVSNEPIGKEAIGDKTGDQPSRHDHTPSYRQKSVLWWALVCVPVIVLLGLGSSAISGSGEGSPWFEMLTKPAIYPPGWLFGVVWTILYSMMGFALALVLASDRKEHKKPAIVMFAVQLAVNLLWSPIFFGMHMIAFGFFWIMLLLVLVIATIAYFARVSRVSAALLVPYLLWVCFAALLNLQFWQLN